MPKTPPSTSTPMPVLFFPPIFSHFHEFSSFSPTFPFEFPLEPPSTKPSNANHLSAAYFAQKSSFLISNSPFSPPNPAHAYIFPTRLLSRYFFLIFCPNRPSIEHFSLLFHHFLRIFIDFFLIFPFLCPSTRHSCHSLPHPILPKTFSPQISQSVIFSILSSISF